MITNSTTSVSRAEARRVWLKVAIQSFGGPAGQIAVVHRLIVDEKKWLTEERFLHALSYCMLLPGPEAQQLTTYVGWLLHGVRGGLIAGCLFIAPGFLAILALSVLYADYRDLGFVAGIFFGLKPAVLAVVFEAVVRLRRRALTNKLSVLTAAMAFMAIFVFAVPFPFIVAGAALAGFLFQRTRISASPAEEFDDARAKRPSLVSTGRTALIWLMIWWLPLIALVAMLGRDHVFVQEGFFFSKSASVTFGGAYAVLSYVAQQAVDAYQWLGPGEMLDGLGMAETTPGPLIQVVQFVGFMGAYRNAGGIDPMLAGILGSIVTTWVTFAPCFLFIFVGAPYVEYLRGHRALTAAMKGITAAVVGVVLNLAVWFSVHTLFGRVDPLEFGIASILVPNLSTLDLAALTIAVGAMVSMFKFKVGMLQTLAMAAMAGVIFEFV